MSDIPDSISTDSLRSLLNNNQAPMSDVIPEINFGNQFGGPCDLQYVVSSLISKSTHGVNLIQLMMSALHMLTEVEARFSKQIETLKVDFADNSQDGDSSERQSLLRTAERNHAYLRSSLMALEQVLEAFSPVAYQARIRELVQTGEFIPSQKPSEKDFHSMMLFSSELINSLNISRESLSNYLQTTDAYIE